MCPLCIMLSPCVVTVIYMDDILIHVQNKEDLQEKTRKVLAKLKEHNLYLKLEKCKLVTKEWTH